MDDVIHVLTKTCRRAMSDRMARPTEKKALRVVGYTRVSTTKQAEEGVSLAAQRERLAKYCELYGHELVALHADEGESAKTLDRPALREALALLSTGKADALLVVKLDRLTRSVRDLGALLETHFAAGRAVLLSVHDSIDTSTAAGRLTLNLLVSVAQWEREAIGERTKQALEQVKADGGRIGALPYGERRGDVRDSAGRLVVQPDATDAAAVALARELWAGGASLATIAVELRLRGFKTRRTRGSWGPGTVHAIVTRPAPAPVPGREPLRDLTGLEVPYREHAMGANGGGALRERIAAKIGVKQAVRAALDAWRKPPAVPLESVELLLWRGPRSRAWDGDNAAARAKPVRDVVARWLGVDDREGAGVDRWEARSVWRGGRVAARTLREGFASARPQCV